MDVALQMNHAVYTHASPGGMSSARRHIEAFRDGVRRDEKYR